LTISVLILTFNEAQNISDCLESVSWCDDVVVLDSFSTDATVEIAGSSGARVVQRQFDDYASQRNFGLREINYRHPWILMLDADERVPADLHAEMQQVVASAPPELCLLRMRRRDHLFGRWIPRSSGYPTWFARLMRVGRAWIERPINEEFKTDGQVGNLSGHLDHYPFNKGFHEWIVKHDRYSTMEARLLVSSAAPVWRWRDLMARDPVRRRAALKALVYALPARPALMFIALYFLRGGILEGRAGYTFCALRASYEFMIDCKVRELKRRAQGLPV
jgi:glycosyltransferase involved in cell wall biosynthesis